MWRIVAAGTLALTTAYLIYGVHLNRAAEASVRAELADAGTPAHSVRAYPTLLQIFLRRVVARTDERIYVGWHTPLGDGKVFWAGDFSRPPEGPLTRDLHATWEGQTFVWFTMGETITHRHRIKGGHLIQIEDLRYGFPGMPADRGMWGIQARYNTRGQRLGDVSRYQMAARSSSSSMQEILGGLWQSSWGDYSALKAWRWSRDRLAGPSFCERLG